jgi:hypothetical protein
MSSDVFDEKTMLVTDARIQSLRPGISSNCHKKANRRGFRGNPKRRSARSNVEWCHYSSLSDKWVNLSLRQKLHP